MTDLTNKYNEKYMINLIDRLKVCSEIKYPNRKWSNNFYLEVVCQWKNKIELLEKRVINLENELNNNKI